MKEQKFLNQFFEDMPKLDFPNFNNSQANVQNENNTEYHDCYADFTEIEDENGNILLIKYSDLEFEFRGNKYCEYILCNEKTNSREKGIAQIKGGQYVWIKDNERVQNIKEFIHHEFITNLDKCIKLKSIDGFNDLVYIGYMLNREFRNKTLVLYQIGHSKNCYVIEDIYKLKGLPADFSYIEELLKHEDKLFFKNPCYKFPDKDSFYDISLEINGEELKLKKLSSYNLEDQDETLILYQIMSSGKYIVVVIDENGDLDIENDIDYITDIFDEFDESELRENLLTNQQRKPNKNNTFSIGKVFGKFFKH